MHFLQGCRALLQNLAAASFLLLMLSHQDLGLFRAG